MDVITHIHFGSVRELICHFDNRMSVQHYAGNEWPNRCKNRCKELRMIGKICMRIRFCYICARSTVRLRRGENKSSNNNDTMKWCTKRNTNTRQYLFHPSSHCVVHLTHREKRKTLKIISWTENRKVDAASERKSERVNEKKSRRIIQLGLIHIYVVQATQCSSALASLNKF